MRAGARFTVSPFDRSGSFGVLFLVVREGFLFAFILFVDGKKYMNGSSSHL